MQGDTFKAWAIVELFGHQRAAGEISEQAIGGETFIRLDIPRAEGPAYTRLFGKGAIYCINICEEDTARRFATRLSEPLYAYTALPAPAPPRTDTLDTESYGAGESFRGRREDDDFDDDEDVITGAI